MRLAVPLDKADNVSGWRRKAADSRELAGFFLKPPVTRHNASMRHWTHDRYWELLRQQAPWWGGLIGVLLVAAVAVRRIRQLLSEGNSGPDGELERKLSELKELEQGGGLDPTEIRSIRSRMVRTALAPPPSTTLIATTPHTQPVETADTVSSGNGTPVASDSEVTPPASTTGVATTVPTHGRNTDE